MSNANKRKPGKLQAITDYVRIAQVTQREGLWILSNKALRAAMNCGLRRGERDEVRRSIANNMKQARLDLARGA